MKLAKHWILTTTALVAVTAGALLSATIGQAVPPRHPLADVDAPPAPKFVPNGKVKVPVGNRLTGVYPAEGVQTYTCTDGAWKLLEPAAILRAKKDGRTVALHSRGPVWVSTVDGSAVNAIPIATSPKPRAVPALLLKSTATRGTGVFADVSYIQRLDTRGGVAPPTPSKGAEQTSVPYSALYTFYQPANYQPAK